MLVALADGYRMFVQEVGAGFPLIVLHGGPGLDHTHSGRTSTRSGTSSGCCTSTSAAKGRANG
jgi:hypothetical protein